MPDKVHIPLDDNIAPGTWRLDVEDDPIYRCPECKRSSAMRNHSVSSGGEVNALIACFPPCPHHIWGILDGWTHGEKAAGKQTVINR
jgi:hypothetical protein